MQPQNPMNNSPIDLRSDTVTRPVEAMRNAMQVAELGDDVYGDDPTVNRLEALAATVTGKQAAVFVPSGTQSNLIALLAHCQRGDEYIVGHDAHTYKYEGGGAAALGGIQPQTIAFDENAELPLEAIASVIKPDDSHFAKTRLLALENTQHGRVVSLDYIERARGLCDQHGLKFHLDGARVCNAAVAQGVSVETITRHFDTVSVCLSKGLGAPVGSVLCGGSEVIAQARRWRKVTGGGMRQAGVIAAAGIYSLENMIERLVEDHQNAKALEALLMDAPGVKVRSGWTQTNMVWLDLQGDFAEQLVEKARDKGLLVSAHDRVCRLVLHHDVPAESVQKAGQALKTVFEELALAGHASGHSVDESLAPSLQHSTG